MTIRAARAVSGYPEWLPEARVEELRWMDHIRGVFERFGYCSIQTPSVEEVAVLVSKGEDSDKEIYALRRLVEEGARSEPRVALHYDLTVPFARYVAQHYNDLVFPFKRYQMQSAWRGERPQEGRFREFFQCDIDVVDNERLSLHFDAEVVAVTCEALRGLPIGDFSIRVSNRKILQGYYAALGIDDVVGAIRIVDKLDKIGPHGVTQLLVDRNGLSSATAAACLALAELRGGSEVMEQVRALGQRSDLLEQGLCELKFVLDTVVDQGFPVIADLSIARGFDYYTGTVYEGKLAEFPTYPSICSGGRYDNLVGGFLNKRLPGVGMSIGLTRIFSKMLKEGRVPLAAKGPTQVLVAYVPGSSRADIADRAGRLRRGGFCVEGYHEPDKLGDQLRYATRKGIPYVLFPGQANQPDEVKDMRARTQFPVARDWTPPDEPRGQGNSNS